MQTFGPYSPVRQAGNNYYISGQVGIDPQSSMAMPDITGQTKQVLTNLQAVLDSHALTPADIIKTTIYVTNMGDLPLVNKLYESYFPTPRPARATVAVAELPRVAGDTPLLIEIEAVAYKESK